MEKMKIDCQKAPRTSRGDIENKFSSYGLGIGVMQPSMVKAKGSGGCCCC